MTGVCSECGCTTGGAALCWQHAPYTVHPLKDGSYRVQGASLKYVTLSEPPPSYEYERAALLAERDALAATDESYRQAADLNRVAWERSQAERDALRTALRQLQAEADELANCAEALHRCRAGTNTGMGSNIITESAGLVTYQIKRVRAALAAVPRG